MSIKPPKQIKRWLYKARLRACGWRPTVAVRCGYASYEGHDRLWRIVEGHLDVSCPIAEFDRWANSLEIRVPLPTCEKEFLWTVKRISA